jgi:hypothetical protein
MSSWARAKFPLIIEAAHNKILRRCLSAVLIIVSADGATMRRS